MTHSQSVLDWIMAMGLGSALWLLGDAVHSIAREDGGAIAWTVVTAAISLLVCFSMLERKIAGKKQTRTEQPRPDARRLRERVVFDSFRRNPYVREKFVGVCMGISAATRKPLKEVMRKGIQLLADDLKSKIKD